MKKEIYEVTIKRANEAVSETIMETENWEEAEAFYYAMRSAINKEWAEDEQGDHILLAWGVKGKRPTCSAEWKR